jgi:hypothetical protein
MVVRRRWFAREIRPAAREIIELARCLLVSGLLQATMAAGAEPLVPAPRVSEFAWLGTVAGVESGSLVRIALPADALTRLQSRAGHDVRVLNAAGEVIPYAVTGGDGPVRQRHAVQTRAFSFTSTATQAIADLRTEVQLLAALDIKGVWHRNTLVSLQVAVSDNLQDWTPVPVKGPVYRFEGAEPPVNTVLELQEPLSVEGRYLRVTWPGHTGVKLASLTGRVAGLRPPVPAVRAELGGGVADGASGLVWSFAFATPLSAVHLHMLQGDDPVPLRISARADPAQPWKLLASTVVYRQDLPGGQGSNPPQALPDAQIAQLRIEAGNGVPLPAGGLRLAAELSPMQVLFLATGKGPYTVAAGRAGTAQAAVELESLIPGPAMVPDIVPLRPVKQLRAVLPGAPQLWAASLMPAHWKVRGPVLWALFLVALAVAMAAVFALLRPPAAKPVDTLPPQ